MRAINVILMAPQSKLFNLHQTVIFNQDCTVWSKQNKNTFHDRIISVRLHTILYFDITFYQTCPTLSGFVP